MQSSQKHFVLGLFFLSALCVLGYYTLFLTDFRLFGDPVRLTVEFPEAHGLREGDPVMVSGMRLGRVKSLAYDPHAPPERRITVVMYLNQELEIRQGYVVRIEESTLLGGRNVEIDPGPRGAAPLDVGDARPLVGTVASNPLEALQEAGEVVADVFQNLSGGGGAIGRLVSDEELGRKIDAFVTDFGAMVADGRTIAEELRQGKGTLGKLLVDEQLHLDIANAAANLDRITAEVRSGQGVLGRLVRDNELADELSRAVRALREIGESIAAGEGTLGRVLRDESIALNIERVTGDLAEGRGSLGALITTRELYDRVLAISDEVRAVASAVRQKEGSLGELIMSKDLYNEVLTAVKLLNRSLEDYRESAPVSTFTSIFFGAF